MKWFTALIFTCTCFAALGQEAKIPYPDCYCTDKTGARVEMGTMICLEVGGRSFIARCEMSLNNPMWREIKQGCLSSQLQEPAIDAPLINA